MSTTQNMAFVNMVSMEQVICMYLKEPLNCLVTQRHQKSLHVILGMAQAYVLLKMVKALTLQWDLHHLQVL